MSLRARALKAITWREGTNAPLNGHFAALRVRRAGGNVSKAKRRPLQWLLIAWLKNQAEPCKHILPTLSEGMPITDLVSATCQRRRIKRDDHSLKQDFGLGHDEGRG